MATINATIGGRTYNYTTILNAYATDGSGNVYVITPFLIGAVEIVPVKRTNISARPRGKFVQSVPGEDQDGSLKMTLLGTMPSDVDSTGSPTFYECLAQSGPGQGFVPWTTVVCSTFDNDDPNIPALFTVNDHCWLFSFELPPAQGGDPIAKKNQLIQVYACCETPTIDIPDASATSKLEINGIIQRRGMITISTV